MTWPLKRVGDFQHAAALGVNDTSKHANSPASLLQTNAITASH